jgi:hypothetical protein
MSTSHITKDDEQRYVLTKDDIVNAPPALKSSPNEFDWPLMIALWKETKHGAGEDCRLKDAFRCLRNAAIHREYAYAYRTEFGIDSAWGWGAATRADGTIIIFLFDGSPAGQILPERAGWRLDYTVCKTLADERSAKRTLCGNPYFGRDKK